MTTGPTYDRIGTTYADTRRPDPRIAAQIAAALGDAATVVSVGAGAGSYENNRTVVAVEPSLTMIRQRTTDAAPAVRAVAEALPFPDDSFAAALASLTIHHWSDWRRGLDEMCRVARRCVVFTYEPQHLEDFWLTADYFPQITELDYGRFPTIEQFSEHLGDCTVDPVPVPEDCVDGFLAAFWRRPKMYLDAGIRAGMSGFHELAPDVIAHGIQRLSDDLRSGAWDERYGHLRGLTELDIGYRLVISDRSQIS
jgi:SAM-dependent methyltransferase